LGRQLPGGRDSSDGKGSFPVERVNFWWEGHIPSWKGRFPVERVNSRNGEWLLDVKLNILMGRADSRCEVRLPNEDATLVEKELEGIVCMALQNWITFNLTT
jgi:hypothetical protein